MRPLDDLECAVCTLVSNRREFDWALSYPSEPDFERLARLRLAHDFAAVECAIALARWIRE